MTSSEKNVFDHLIFCIVDSKIALFFINSMFRPLLFIVPPLQLCRWSRMLARQMTIVTIGRWAD
jgi:hypothetical protein